MSVVSFRGAARAWVWSIAGLAVAVGVAHGQNDLRTAPASQLVPWHNAAGMPPRFHPLNSVVELNRFNGAGQITNFGTGTVIGTTVRFEGAQPVGWLCVLTADHVVNLGPANEYRVRFGNAGAQGSFGGGTNLRFLAPDPVAVGGQNLPRDLAVMGIRYGPVDAFFSQLTPITPVVRTEATTVGTNFSEIGYGDTGQYVAAGAVGVGSPAGIRRDGRDSIKGFQNNTIDNGADHMRARPGGGNYNFRSVEFDLDQPAAPAAMGPHPFLVAEGTSFPGDSGGPYLFQMEETQSVNAFARPGAGSDWNPAGGVGDMPIRTTGLFAVHSYGFNPDVGQVTPYGSISGGVLLNNGDLTWITNSHAQIPAPAALAPLFAMGILAHRRLR